MDDKAANGLNNKDDLIEIHGEALDFLDEDEENARAGKSSGGKAEGKPTVGKQTKKIKNTEKENEERRRKAMMSLITQAQRNTNTVVKQQFGPTYQNQRSRQLARNKIRSNSIQKEILGERPKHKFSQFLKTNFNKDGLKTLLIDLDETLVHSSFTQVAEPDFILSVEIEGKMCNVYVLVRPGAKEFLENLAPFYEMVIYTASLSKYADPLMDILDPKGLCTARLFREHCTFYNGIFVKDLSKIDRDPRDLLILDNSPNSYLFQPESALPIVSWYDDMNDTILYDYIPLLQGLSIVDDVRVAFEAFVYPNEQYEYDRVDFNRAMEILDEYIVKAREFLIPEYEAKHRTRIFSEPRTFQKHPLDEDQEEDLIQNKTFAVEPSPLNVNNSAIVKRSKKLGQESFKIAGNIQNVSSKESGVVVSGEQANSSLPSATNDFNSPLMNTWTNNKFTANKEAEGSNQNKKKMSFRPRSGNPSPTKMYDESDRIGMNQIMTSYNIRGNQIYNVKQNYQGINNEAVIFRSYSNTKQNITPVSIQSQFQSNNPPQPHQRHIK